MRRPARFARLLAAAGLLVAAACSGAATTGGADSASAPQAAAAPTQYLYVASQSGPAVSIIDMDERELVKTIWLTDLGFTPNAKPHHTAVEPDGSAWYVSLISDGKVLKFNAQDELVGQADFETPGMLAIDPVEDLLYVGRSMAAVNPPQRIGVIQRSDMHIEEYDVFFPRPHAIAAGEGGGRVYTASLAVNQIASLAPEEDDLELVNLDGEMNMFVQLAESPDGGTLVTGGQMSGDVLVFDLADPAKPALIRTIHVGGEPWHPSYSPDGRFVYFPQRTTDSVAVIDTTSWEQVATITGDGLIEPHGSAISADGGTLWVSARNTKGTYHSSSGRRTSVLDQDGEPLPTGLVVAIDTGSRQVVAVIEVPAYAAGMSAGPAH